MPGQRDCAYCGWPAGGLVDEDGDLICWICNRSENRESLIKMTVQKPEDAKRQVEQSVEAMRNALAAIPEGTPAHAAFEKRLLQVESALVIGRAGPMRPEDAWWCDWGGRVLKALRAVQAGGDPEDELLALYVESVKETQD